jgi:hypothetical protein
MPNTRSQKNKQNSTELVEAAPIEPPKKSNRGRKKAKPVVLVDHSLQSDINSQQIESNSQNISIPIDTTRNT